MLPHDLFPSGSELKIEEAFDTLIAKVKEGIVGNPYILRKSLKILEVNINIKLYPYRKNSYATLIPLLFDYAY
jgi:hypothetical protein